MALAVLGLFVFRMATIPYQSLERSQTWKHPNQNIVGGGIPPSQYTGKDPDEINITAELRPEITGSTNSINQLRKMADTGQPYPLILGTGRLLGSFVILSIQENQSEFNFNGEARAINFTMTLKKVAEHAFGVKGEALGIMLGMARKITGI